MSASNSADESGMATDGQTLIFPYRIRLGRTATSGGFCAALGLAAGYFAAQDRGLVLGSLLKLSSDTASWIWLYAAALAFSGTAFFVFAQIASALVRQRFVLTETGLLAPTGFFSRDTVMVRYDQITALAVSGYGSQQSLTVNWSGEAVTIKSAMLPGVTSFDLIHRRLASELAAHRRRADDALAKTTPEKQAPVATAA